MFAISIVKENIRIKNRSKSKYSLRSNPKEVKRTKRVQKNYSFSKVWFIKFNNFILMNFFVYYYLKIKKKKNKKQKKRKYIYIYIYIYILIFPAKSGIYLAIKWYKVDVVKKSKRNHFDLMFEVLLSVNY